MKLKDIRNGLVVERRTGTRCLLLDGVLLFNGGYTLLSEYNENLTHYRLDFLDIVKVYAIKTPKDFNDIFFEEYLELLWEREARINWHKVPDFTKVQVRGAGQKEWGNRYFVGVDEDGRYRATCCGEFTYQEGAYICWSQIRLHPSVEVDPEWLEEVE